MCLQGGLKVVLYDIGQVQQHSCSYPFISSRSCYLMWYDDEVYGLWQSSVVLRALRNEYVVLLLPAVIAHTVATIDKTQQHVVRAYSYTQTGRCSWPRSSSEKQPLGTANWPDKVPTSLRGENTTPVPGVSISVLKSRSESRTVCVMIQLQVRPSYSSILISV